MKRVLLGLCYLDELMCYLNSTPVCLFVLTASVVLLSAIVPTGPAWAQDVVIDLSQQPAATQNSNTARRPTLGVSDSFRAEQLALLESQKPSMWVSGALALVSVGLIAGGVAAIVTSDSGGFLPAGIVAGAVMIVGGGVLLLIAGIVGAVHLVRRAEIDREIRALGGIAFTGNGFKLRF